MSIFGGTINLQEASGASFWTPYLINYQADIGTFGNLASAGGYINVGRLVFVHIYAKIGAAVGGATVLYIQLPYVIADDNNSDKSFDGMLLQGYINNGATIRHIRGTMYNIGHDGFVRIDPDDGLGINLNDEVRISGCYVRKKG